ncbi:unnamed protein product [Ectocarpus sp. 12 AP-2014]
MIVAVVIVMVGVVFVHHHSGRGRGHGVLVLVVVVVVVVVDGCGRRGDGLFRLKRAVGDLDGRRLVLDTRGAGSVVGRHKERGKAGRRREGRGWGAWVGLHATNVSPLLLTIFIFGACEDGALPTKRRIARATSSRTKHPSPCMLRDRSESGHTKEWV